MSSRAQKKQAAHRLRKQKKATRATKKKQAAIRSKRDVATRGKRSAEPRCGLCGATTNLTKTECCGRWICDDEDQYVLFSYAHNSCSRNHRRYTLCGSHFAEQHPDRWQDCAKCRDEIETEMYVYYGTNEYNFEVLDNPPAYEPTLCQACGRIIVLADGGYSVSGSEYLCELCTAKEHPDLFRT